MAVMINTNVASLNAQRNLSGTQNALSRNLSRLSSGLRITRAADDAAGLAISESFKSQIRSTAAAERNANDGISLSQVAEGALDEVAGILTRMRELAVQSANGTVDATSRGYLQSEYSALRNEIDRISNVTEFNGTKLLQGSLANGLTLQVGIGSSTDDRLVISLGDSRAAVIGSAATTAQLDDSSLSTQTLSQSALASIDTAISDISSRRATLGSFQNRLEVTISNLASARENLSAANSRIRDVDVAEETAAMTRNQILSQAGVAVLAQANQIPATALSLLR